MKTDAPPQAANRPAHASLAATRGCRLVTTSTSARVLLAGQLRRLDDICWTVVSGDDYPDPPPGLDVERVPMRRDLALSDFVAFARLLRLFRAKRFDFVQTHTPKASLLGLPAARLAGTVPVYTMHGSLYFSGNSRLRNIAGWAFERWCCAWASRVLLQSREDLAVLQRSRICSDAKLRYIGNGIQPERFPLTPLPPATDRPTVLMISRLVAEKGCRDFFAMAQALRESARFVHVGPVEHDQRDAITDDERRAASAGGVEFVGEVDDVRPFISAAHIVVLPSYREGIPRAAMEAAAMGRPVVAYDIRGVREVIPPSAHLLAPLGDVDTLVARVRELAASTDEQVRKGRMCADNVQQFSEQAVVARLRKAYAEMGVV